MIMPRVSSVRRVIVFLGVLVVCSWVWLTTSSFSPVTDHLPNGLNTPSIMTGGLNYSLVSRSHIPVHLGAMDKEASDKSSQHSHHHSNHSLEHLRKNMTLLKVNMSGIERIMDKFNKPKDEVSSSEKGTHGRHTHHIRYANPHPFKYIINNKIICKDKDVFILVYIHTAPDHYKRRMVIRQTWGNTNQYEVHVKLVFIMGNTTDKPEIQQALLFEAEQYGDIIQEDFLDTYKNLTYKGIAALKWISNYCSHAKFVLKTDDDIFVNMFTLLKHLVSMDRLGVDNKGILLCLVWYKMKVMREGKWKVSEDQWKDSYYPTYCSGSAFTMSTDAAIAMHNVSYHVPFFWVDDFYITGLLPLKLNGTVRHKQFMSTYVLNGNLLEEKFTGPQWFTYIFSHVHNLNSIQSVWNRLVKLNKGEVRAPVKYALPGQLPKEVAKPKKA